MKPTPRSRADAPRSPRRVRPHIEWLESRQQPGETFGFGLLGGALAGTALDFFSLPLGAVPPDQELAREYHPLLTRGMIGEAIPMASGEHPPSGVAARTATNHQVLPALVQPPIHLGDFDVLLEDLPVLPVAIQRTHGAALSGLKVPDGGSVETATAIGAWSSATVAETPSSGSHEPDYLSHFIPLGGSAPRLEPNRMAFDPWSGVVAIRGDGADHTLQEALSARGFVEVSLDGQPHSSDPASTAFDPLLAGATAARLTGIRLDGAGGQDTLVLGAQQLAGGLQVNAPGAKVVTEDVTVGGQLAVQASDITVRGALRGSAVTLAATGWVSVEDTGKIVTGSADAGGRVAVFADKFVNTGQLHADGASGGQVVAAAGNVLNAGSITANGTNGGGTVRIAFTGAYIDTVAALTAANDSDGPGGHVTIEGGTTGRLFSSGRQQATGSVGGAVDLLGREVVLDGGAVDTSGETGGGSVRVGQVANLPPVAWQVGNLPPAKIQTVTVTAATTIRADALHAGNGGQVAVWADQDGTFAGTVSARGGSDGGAGGFIDVSSQGGLSYAGAADAGAPAGKAGTLLLDPKNLIVDAKAGVFPQFNLIDPHPTVGGHFGSQVTVRSNGNVVVTNPDDNFGGARAGAVYLFNGLTSALIGSLVGSNPGDQVAAAGVTPLANGNYVVGSPSWNGMIGATTWESDRTGISGIVSAANSLVGAIPGDQVGSVTPLSNGNYLVGSLNWNGNRGAMTWGNGTAGVRGVVSAANSLVGANPGDQVGGGFLGVVTLSNGNYLVKSGYSDRGSVTWGNGSAGVSGIVSAANSLVGSDPGDGVGYQIVYLSNGSYVLVDPFWNGNRGAVTWGSGRAGVTGVVSAANSLVGSNPSDRLGDNLGGVIPLSNGSYVVLDPFWNDNRGAVTWGSASAGVSGTISAANSLVGSNPGNVCYSGANVGDCLGYNNGYNDIAALSNGNYVVGSPNWNGGRGAATWGNASAGISGIVSETNSLVGSNSSDQVGAAVTPCPTATTWSTARPGMAIAAR